MKPSAPVFFLGGKTDHSRTEATLLYTGGGGRGGREWQYSRLQPQCNLTPPPATIRDAWPINDGKQPTEVLHSKEYIYEQVSIFFNM